MKRITGQGSVSSCEPGKSSKRCRKWRLLLVVVDDATGEKSRKCKRVTGMSKTEALDALVDFRCEIERELSVENREEENEKDLDLRRPLESDELLMLKAAVVAARQILILQNNDFQDPTVDEYAAEYVQYRRDAKVVSEATQKQDQRAVDTMLLHLAGRRVSSITPKDIRRFYAAIQQDGGTLSGKALSGTSAQDVAITTTMIFKQAVQDGIISKSPCLGVPLPRIDTEERRALTPNEQTRLVRVLSEGEPTAEKVALLLMLSCGLRRGEACGLRWCDVDMARKTITVNHSFSQSRKADGTIVGLKRPKTREGIRTIPLGKRTFSRLMEWRTAQGLHFLKMGIPRDDSAPVISTGICSHMRPSKLANYWQKLRAKMGIDASLHLLRHTYATNLMARGVDMVSAMYLMGHKNSEMLTKIYAHVVSENLIAAAQTAEDAAFDNMIMAQTA